MILNPEKRKKDYLFKFIKSVKVFQKKRTLELQVNCKELQSRSQKNIAERFARYHYKEKARIYYQARGSLAEIRSFLILIKDLNILIERGN